MDHASSLATAPWRDAYLPSQCRVQRVAVRNGNKGNSEEEWTMNEDRHSGDDDKQTDHLDKGSDGHTVESGDEK